MSGLVASRSFLFHVVSFKLGTELGTDLMLHKPKIDWE